MAAMADPHTAAELSIDDIVSMCDELLRHIKTQVFPVCNIKHPRPGF